ncbi:MAG: calycin-like domain-containing protein [Bacteroides sp.]
MKKKVLNVFFLTLMSLLVFTGCSKDEEVLPLESEVAGTYKGSLDITVDGISMGNNIPKNISITKSAGNKVNLELKDFVFMNIPLGTITLSNCEVKLSGKTYSFDGNQTLTSLPEAIGECLVEAEGTIVGQAIALRLNITVKKLNQKVLVVYSGNKLSGSESAEAKILSFTFDSNVVTEQPTIDETAGTIVFKVSSDATAEQLKLTPTIAISDKAVMMPATGVTQDFSNNNKVT